MKRPPTSNPTSHLTKLETPPPGFTAAEWLAVCRFLDRHTDADGNCDVEAMNREARANFARLGGGVAPIPPFKPAGETDGA